MNISIDEIKNLIGKINIIDIRDTYLYNLSHIPTAKNIPLKYIEMFPDKYLKKEIKYYIYCSYGVTSNKLCLKLNEKGYKLVNIIGGFSSYKQN